MIEIIPKWGAMYLKYDEPINIKPKKLVSVQNVRLIPGQELRKIGAKKRTSFEVNEGFKLIYEGVLSHEKNLYAVFNCTGFDVSQRQLELFSSPVNYRYVFNIVPALGNKVSCFLIFTQNWLGCRDVVLDEIQ